MDPVTLTALATMGSAGAGLGGNLLSNRANRREGDRQRGHELDMWHKVNAYNSPSAQMDRLREAGLSPHLAIPGIQPAQQPHQTPNAPEVNPFETLLPHIAQMTEIMKAQDEMRNNEVQRNYVTAQTVNAELEPLKWKLQEHTQKLDNMLKEGYYNIAGDMHYYNTQIRAKEVEKTSLEIRGIVQQMAQSMEAHGMSMREVQVRINGMLLDQGIKQEQRKLILDNLTYNVTANAHESAARTLRSITDAQIADFERQLNNIEYNRDLSRANRRFPIARRRRYTGGRRNRTSVSIKGTGVSW
jgi:hypothetical protein